MSGPRDKHDEGDLDELVHDFDLDMDAPLGAYFAAAQPPVDDLPPITMHEAEPVADDVAGQGLGYDYAFGAGHDGGDRTIPRIVVHAFCNRTSSLNLMRTIMQDRRMKNVTMEVHAGGVAAATQYYVNETTPNLLVIEGAGDPRQLLADLDSLAEHCDESALRAFRCRGWQEVAHRQLSLDRRAIHVERCEELPQIRLARHRLRFTTNA